MKTAVIYARYSSDSQTEQSIEGQLRVCKDYAQRNEITIVKTYIDRAMTGTNDNRPDFQQMIKDSYKKQWNYVIVYKLDRFSRNKYETTIHKHTLSQNGVKLLSAMENIPDTPEGIILESLLEGMNQYYSAELAQKVKRGMYESRLKGNFTGGSIPYGYKVENKKILIDEPKAEVIRNIFSQYACGKTVPEIIESMTAKGILHNGSPFKKTTLYKILQNERYIGIYKIKGEYFPNMYPKIVNEEIFEKVRKKSLSNKVGSRSVQSVYLFRHKLICGYCGMPISVETSRTRCKNKLDYYKCLGIKKYRNGCPKRTVRKELIEDYLLDAIINELNKPETIKIIVEKVLEIQKENNGTNNVIENLNKLKNQAQKSLDNLIKAVELGVVTKTTSQRIKELENQIDELERQIVIEQSKQDYILTEDEIYKYYSKALKLESLTLINYIIKEIKLYNDKAEIIFNSPLKKSPNSHSFFIFRKTIIYNSLQHNLPEIIEIKISFGL